MVDVMHEHPRRADEEVVVGRHGEGVDVGLARVPVYRQHPHVAAIRRALPVAGAQFAGLQPRWLCHTDAAVP